MVCSARGFPAAALACTAPTAKQHECRTWAGRHVWQRLAAGLVAADRPRIPNLVSMVTFRGDTCDKCKNASPVSYRVEAVRRHEEMTP